MRLAGGDRGASSWNHHAAAGRVPTVAPTVAPTPFAAHWTGQGTSGGTQRVTQGVTRTSPTTAPKESCIEGLVNAVGSTTSTAMATRPSRGKASICRPPARPMAARVRSPAARWALTGAPAPRV